MAGEPTINPYAPPVASIDAPPVGASANRFDRPLFSPRQIGVATFFGSVLAGVLMLQANFRVMRRSGDANKALGLGLLAFAALITLVFFVPKGAQTPINIALAFGMSKLAGSLQGQAFFDHTIAGGEKRSNWLVFAIVIAALVAVVVVGMIVGIVKVRMGADLPS